MKEFSVAELARIIEAQPIQPTKFHGSLTGVSIDSRTTKGGDCFFAIEGDNFDGHDYINEAFAKGAVCVVVRQDISEKLTGQNILKVGDTIKALGDFAVEYRRQINFKVVAITGSVGKTTTRQIVHHVLTQRYRVFQSPGNFNNELGLPLTLLGADPEDEIIVSELGSNHPGEIANLTRIAQPDIAVITNVFCVHLEGLGDLQAIINEKLSITDGLRSDGELLINGDSCELVAACRAKGVKFTTFGQSNSCSVRVRDVELGATGSTFTIDGNRVSIPLPGAGNVQNATAAWAVCSRFGIETSDFAEAVKTLPSLSMRAQLLQIAELTVLNDCYNASPVSVKNALNILTNLDSSGQRRLVFICGDMAELGPQSDKLHAELGVLIGHAEVRLLLTAGKSAKVAASSAKQTAKNALRIECFDNTVSLCDNLHKFVKDSDIILIKGSRCNRLETVVEKLKTLF